jgi:hypothetical protein
MMLKHIFMLQKHIKLNSFLTVNFNQMATSGPIIFNIHKIYFNNHTIKKGSLED